MDAAPAAIFVAHDAECCYISGNRMAYALLRQQPGGNLSMSAPEGERPAGFRVVRDWVEIPPAQLPIQSAARTGRPVRNCELDLMFEDGTFLHLLGNVEPLLDGNGQPQGAVAVLSDITERKQTEQKLLQIMAAVESTSDAIGMSNAQGGHFYQNQAFTELFGYGSAEELQAAGGVPAVVCEPAVAKQMFDTIQSGGSWRGELKMLTKDGRVFDAFERADGIRGKEGNVIGLIGVITDVTERKRAEAALRESEERFRNMADTAPVMIWVTGPDKLCTFVNKPWLDFTGRSVEQELGNGWAESVHPEDLDRCWATYSSSFDARRSFRMEYRIRRADGDYRWVLDNGTPFYSGGEFAGYIGSCIDITEQKVIEERLLGNEALLKGAQRLAKIGSFERNIENDKAYWSEEMFRIYGLLNHIPPSSAEFLNCVYPEDRQKLLEAHRLVRTSGAPVGIEFRIVRPNGELRFARSILEAVRDDRDAVVSMVGATQDVTDLKRAQEETFARQKLESLGTLASGIAHDFNNLLGAVLAQTELAMAELATGSHPDEELKAIRDVAIRGSEIVRQLMIYVGKESDVLEPVDASKVVEGMLGLLKVAVSRHASLITNPGKDLPPVRARVAQLSQIVMNLVVNASDALGDRDGVIRVTTEHIAVGRAEAMAKALPTGGYVQLEVSDTGCGMSPETQAKVFDPFFTTKFSGRGLGLAVVHGIVRNLRGAIRVASEPGKGTTFQVLLPCAEAGAKLHPDPVFSDEESALPARRATVLVVEDEEQLRLAVAKMLRKSGLEVFEAASGSAAIDLLRARGGEIDVILLDLTIPGGSSQDVVAEAALVRSDMKVILTSAYSEEVAEPMMRTPLLCGFIRKPFKLEDLVQTLRSVLFS
jgi:PAS domain S-box-containing protein